MKAGRRNLERQCHIYGRKSPLWVSHKDQADQRDMHCVRRWDWEVVIATTSNEAIDWLVYLFAVWALTPEVSPLLLVQTQSLSNELPFSLIDVLALSSWCRYQIFIWLFMTHLPILCVRKLPHSLNGFIILISTPSMCHYFWWLCPILSWMQSQMCEIALGACQYRKWWSYRDNPTSHLSHVPT